MFFRNQVPPPPPQVRAPANPNSEMRRPPRASKPKPVQSKSGGGSVTYCVRMCDGRYFPVSNRDGAAELCKAMCPASPTKTFSGRSIGDAVSKEGAAYSAIPNAYIYRVRLIDGCTCDGKSPLGLARVNINADDSLRSGDIVATRKGFMSYRGETRRTAEFEPLKPAALPKTLRHRLAETGITAAPLPVAPAETTGVSSADDAERGAQAVR